MNGQAPGAIHSFFPHTAVFLSFFPSLLTFSSLSLSLPRRNKTKKKAKEEEENAREYGVYVSLPDPARLAVAFKQ